MNHANPLLAGIDAHIRVAGLLEREWTTLREIAQIVAFRVGVRTHTEDVMQESAAAALRSAHQFRFGDDHGFRRWWAKIARGIAIRFARHPSRPQQPEHAVEDGPAATEDGLPPDRRKPEVPQRKISLVDAIWNLEQSYREVILIRNYLMLDWDTIALILRKPSAAAARQHYVRGLAVLKRDLIAWMAQAPQN